MLNLSQEHNPISLNKSKCKEKEHLSGESERKLLPKNEICEGSNSILQDNSIDNNKFVHFIRKEKIRKLVNKFVSNLFLTSNVVPQRMKQFQQVDHYLSQYDNQFSTNVDDANCQEKRWNIISLDNKYLVYWYLFRLLMNLASIFIISFQNYLSFNQLFIPELFIIIFSALEILFNTRLSIQKNGNYIMEQKEIIKSYLQKDFIIDSLSFLIWIIFLTTDNNSKWIVIEIIQLWIIIFKLAKCYFSIIEQFKIQDVDRWEIELGQLILIICINAYIIGCIWFYIGDKGQLYLEYSWLFYLNIETQNPFILFNYSINWALSILVTIGYGNIIPQNWIEILFTNIILVFSIIFYAYSFKTVCSIIKKFDRNNYQYNQMFFSLKRFLIKNNVPNELQLVALQTLKEKINSKKNVKKQEKMTEIMAMMPQKIKNLIDKQISENFINESKELKQIFTPLTIRRIAQISERIDLQEEEILFSSNNDLNLYIIQSGEIALYEQKSKKVFQILTANEKFGEKAFFTGFRQQYSAKSIKKSIIHKIPRNLFIQFIQYNDNDFQKFHQIKDEIIFNKSYKECYSYCQICKEQSHITFECPFLSYQRKQFLVKQNINNERKKFPSRQNWKHKNFKSQVQFLNQYSHYKNTKNKLILKRTRKLQNIWSFQQNNEQSEEQISELNDAYIDWGEDSNYGSYYNYSIYENPYHVTIPYKLHHEFEIQKEYDIYKPNGNKLEIIRNARRQKMKKQESNIYHG